MSGGQGISATSHSNTHHYNSAGLVLIINLVISIITYRSISQLKHTNEELCRYGGTELNTSGHAASECYCDHCSPNIAVCDYLCMTCSAVFEISLQSNEQPDCEIFTAVLLREYCTMYHNV